MLYAITMLANFLAKPLERAKDRGATAVEYGLIVTVIALVMAVGAAALGGGLNDLFADVDARVDPTD